MLVKSSVHEFIESTSSMQKATHYLSLISSFYVVLACQASPQTTDQQAVTSVFLQGTKELAFAADVPEELKNLFKSLKEQAAVTKSYDPEYTSLAYPNGDVPLVKGVCTDVVIRALRKAGIDLQKVVHEDMAANFDAYPKKWGLKSTDSNIDHRRVPNLQTYFTRKRKSLAITDKSADYKPGDVVSWDLNGKGLTHIGIVSNVWSENTQRFLIAHNIGSGTKFEDRIFEWKITGHYRYF